MSIIYPSEEELELIGEGATFNCWEGIGGGWHEHTFVRCLKCEHLMALHNFHCCSFCKVCDCDGEYTDELLHSLGSTDEN